MTKQEAMQVKAEALVRKVVGKTFGQKVDNETIANTAAKVARVVLPYPTKEHISSSDQT